jgi:hypothetical protein
MKVTKRRDSLDLIQELLLDVFALMLLATPILVVATLLSTNGLVTKLLELTAGMVKDSLEPSIGLMVNYILVVKMELLTWLTTNPWKFSELSIWVL